MTVPERKPEMLAEAQATVDRISQNFRRGLITEEDYDTKKKEVLSRM